MPVTKCHKNPLSLTLAPQYPSYHGASVGMAVLAQTFNRLTFVIAHSRILRRKGLNASAINLKISLIDLNIHLLYN